MGWRSTLGNLRVDVVFRHCYSVLILVVFSSKLSKVDLQNFFDRIRCSACVHDRGD